jgi:DNA topoisomerase-1
MSKIIDNMDYFKFINYLESLKKSNVDNMIGGSIKHKTSKIKNQWIDNFVGLYETNPSNSINLSNPTIIHNNLLNNTKSPNDNYGREMAYDDKQKKKKKGIYRVKYEDKNDLDKKGIPKIKFNYFHIATNKPVSSEEQIRINKLGLAPAYDDVWVSDDPNSKIQATGFDVKKRKQYRYNQSHIADASINKFLRLFKFIKSIPKLDTSMDSDIKSVLYSKNRTISVMLLVIKELNMRVGKECYAKTNKSYGVSSMKKSHVSINEEKMIAKFNFKAKSNKQVQYTVTNVDIVKELILLMKLDGEKMFQYKSDSDNVLRVSDVDLNQYIQEKMGKDFSCKDFRTYAANFYFIKALLKETKKRNPTTQKIAKKNISLAQENTAYYLRHTKSISKKSYTMDIIRDMYMNNSDYFIQNKNKQPLTILLDVLKIFKDKINQDRKKNKKLEIDEEKVI